MSRSGYSYDWDDNLVAGRWRGQVASAIRGKRGQAFLIELVAALEAMSEKKLIANALEENGEVCAIGSVGLKRGIDMKDLDPDNPDEIAETFGIAAPLAQEIEAMNDEWCADSTPETRWAMMYKWAKDQLIK